MACNSVKLGGVSRIGRSENWMPLARSHCVAFRQVEQPCHAGEIRRFGVPAAGMRAIAGAHKLAGGEAGLGLGSEAGATLRLRVFIGAWF